MQYVILRTGGKQYKVSAGDTITLDKFEDNGKKSVVFEDVLLAVNDGDISIGKPNLTGIKVEATIVEHKQGEKIRVSKFKAKSRYRKTIGFRAQQSVVKIDKIDFGSSKTAEKTKESTKTAKKETEK
jgi:large subunit ribosomal protein L21